MQCTKAANVLRMSRVTGPSHNLLGVEFTDHTDAECVIEQLDSPGNHEPRITESDVKHWVLCALAGANAEFGTRLAVKRIQYNAADTPDENAYAVLTRELMMRATQLK